MECQSTGSATALDGIVDRQIGGAPRGLFGNTGLMAVHASSVRT
jgi:hypothetical protein